MNRQEMMAHHDDPPARESKPRVQFGKTEAWRDCHGAHRRVEIWYGGGVAGEIAGDTSTGASSDYVLRIDGKLVGPTLYSMKEAKAWARANLFKAR